MKIMKAMTVGAVLATFAAASVWAAPPPAPAWTCAMKEEPQSTLAGAAGEVPAVQFDSTASAAGAVSGLTRGELTDLISKKKESLLIAFYAPWCPHCQRFVMGDGSPLTRLSNALSAKHGARVVKFDVKAQGSPPGFAVNAVPAIYLFNATTGRKSEYDHNPEDVGALESWVLNGGAFPPAAAGAMLQQHGKSSTPAWTCAMADEPQSTLARAADQIPQVVKLDTTTSAAGGVSSLTRAQLTDLISKKKEDLLIAFYAPWCPHCQHFVMGDGSPLTRLSNALTAKHGARVVKFDVKAQGSPPGFAVNAVPTIYLFNATTGRKTEYKENPENLGAFEAWVLNGGASPPAAGSSLLQLRGGFTAGAPGQSWAAFDDSLSHMRGQPTRRQANLLAAAQRRREQAADAEFAAVAASPLSRLSFDAVNLDTREVGAAFDAWSAKAKARRA